MRPTASQAVDGEAPVKRPFCRKAPDVQALIKNGRRAGACLCTLTHRKSLLLGLEL